MSAYLPGYGLLGEALRETERARLYQYHRWTVWIPKALVREHDGAHYAPTYALDKAKQQADDYSAGRL